jgi:hypothetical protein
VAVWLDVIVLSRQHGKVAVDPSPSVAKEMWAPSPPTKSSVSFGSVVLVTVPARPLSTQEASAAAIRLLLL